MRIFQLDKFGAKIDRLHPRIILLRGSNERKDLDMDEEVEERGLDGILARPPAQRRDDALVPFFRDGDDGGGGGLFPGGLLPRIFPGFPGFGYPEQFGHPVSAS